MQIDRARFLVSERGRRALLSVPLEVTALDPLRLGSVLRKTMPSDEAAAIAEQISLRQRHANKLGDGEWLLTPEGAEMMTHPLIAARRAERLAALDVPVVDATAGLGGDLRALIDAGATAMGVERGEATAMLSWANCDGRVVRGDALHLPAHRKRVGVVVDPSRRATRGRRFEPNAFSPTWNEAILLAEGAAVGVMKGPPGLSHELVPEAAELEFVQVGRTLREAALWMGHGARAGLRRAVLLPQNAQLQSDDESAAPGTKGIGTFVIDPESCVTRAGLVQQLATRLHAWLLDEHIAYLSSGEFRPTVLAATFEVLDVMAFSLNSVKRRLRERSWKPAEIRRRAFPIEPDELRRLLGRLEGEEVALLCTTISGKRTVIVGRRAGRNGEDG